MNNFIQIQQLKEKLSEIPKYDILERLKITSKIGVLQVDDANAALLDCRKLASKIGYELDMKTGELTKKKVKI